MGDTERANQINMIMAIVVVLSLIASVVFSFLGSRVDDAPERRAGQDGRRRSRRQIRAPAAATKSATSPRP